MIVGCYAHKDSQRLMTLLPFPGRAKLLLKGGLCTTCPGQLLAISQMKIMARGN